MGKRCLQKTGDGKVKEKIAKMSLGNVLKHVNGYMYYDVKKRRTVQTSY